MNIPYSLIETAGDCALNSYNLNSYSSDLLIESDIGVQGYVSEDETHLKVAIAGTNEFLDLIPHLLALFTSFQNFFTSDAQDKGAYRNSYKSVENQIWSKAFNRLGDDKYRKQCLVTGHSYGGCIAARAAMSLANGGKLVTCITFAEPSFLGGVENEKLNERIINNLTYYRIYNPFDPFGYLPFNLNHYPNAFNVPVTWFGDPHKMKNHLAAIKLINQKDGLH